MTEWRFTLVLEGDVDARLDDLYKAGCDDATFGAVDGVPFADVDREAPDLHSALTSAIHDIESVGLRVRRVEPDDLVTMAEIADRLGRTRESVRLLIAGRRGRGGFPAPATRLRSRTRLWRWSDVARWAAVEGTANRTARLIAAVNATLELRSLRAELELQDARIIDDLDPRPS